MAWVTGAPDPNSPASSVGWHSDASTEGNRDVEFLVSLTAYLQDAYALDPTRCFAVGFSNGGLTGDNCIRYFSGEQKVADHFPGYAADELVKKAVISTTEDTPVVINIQEHDIGGDEKAFACIRFETDHISFALPTA